MLINFDQMETTVIPKFKGGEKEFSAKMFTDANNKILRGTLQPGASIGMHTHTTGSEIIYILRGTGKVIYDHTTENLQPGSCHYCPKGHAHSLINDGTEDLIFFAVIPEQ